MKNPTKVLFFLLSVFFILLIISFFMPEQGLKINNEIIFRFPSINKFLEPKKVEYADITEIIKHNQIVEDTIVIKKQEITIDTFRVEADSLKQITHKIEFPRYDKSVLYSFFESINNKNDLIRILHYGDSQIEGDRITSFLRNKLQHRFGGSGPGLLPLIITNTQSPSIFQSSSSNWETHSLMSKKDTVYNNNRFGILGSFYRFKNISDADNGAWIEFNKSNISYHSVRKFKQCRVFYGNNSNNVNAFAYKSNKMFWFGTMEPSNKIKSFKIDFDTTPNNLKIKFNADKSPDFYAVAFDDVKGIAVDNIPLRGSIGDLFTRADREQLKQMLSMLNVKLIIMQFGVNVVPNIVRSYKYYERILYNQLIEIKKLQPGLPVIVVSVSDMSIKNDDYYDSYPNIKKIRNAQRKAALKADCCFWDMYEAMGGENSMPSWVFANPALAKKDFTHFTYRGSEIIAQMFYNALLYEYNVYNNRKLNK
ncbi:MAG: hypothetical protein IMY72_10205 [Bacteroidetes bacterium]|nr:hypothetical protein [Bacteroidota bacterium]